MNAREPDDDGHPPEYMRKQRYWFDVRITWHDGQIDRRSVLAESEEEALQFYYDNGAEEAEIIK